MPLKNTWNERDGYARTVSPAFANAHGLGGNITAQEMLREHGCEQCGKTVSRPPYVRQYWDGGFAGPDYAVFCSARCAAAYEVTR